MNEIRFTPSSLQSRRAPGNEEGGKPGRTIYGYAIRFNEKSVVLKDWNQRFVEIISPSCVTEAYLKECDIKMTLFHNREKLIARWNKGEGSLRLSVDDKGVYFEFEAPENELGNYAIDAVERGDISGCSFMFAPEEYTTENTSADECLITHTKFAWLGEMTIESDPAYPTSEVGARSLCQSIHEESEKEAESRKSEQQESIERANKEQGFVLDAEFDEIFN